ncbi:MAG: hypothetical protein J6X55_02785 [Victivallales bacterium]|nr:hypothetical protein [Victivallales bacterium]
MKPEDKTILPHPIPGEHYSRSWSYAIPEFREVLKHLRGTPLAQDDTHQLINESHDKYVWHCKDGDFDFAYKTQKVTKYTRFLFNHSLPAREWSNYQAIAQMGIPTPTVLAVGDTRKCFLLLETFIVTSFLNNTHDGRIFMPSGNYREGHDELRREFCMGNMEYLAIFHDNGWLHAAFHARNLLFRELSDNHLELFWIDVARARQVPESIRFDCAIRDLCTFFRDLQISEQEIASYTAHYAACRKNNSLSVEDWLHAMKQSPRWFCLS